MIRHHAAARRAGTELKWSALEFPDRRVTRVSGTLRGVQGPLARPWCGELIKTPGRYGYWAYSSQPLPASLDLPASTARILSEADRALGWCTGAGRLLPNPHLLLQPYIARPLRCPRRPTRNLPSEAARDSRAIEVVDLMFQNPVLVTNRIATELNVTVQSALNHLRRLESEGIVRGA